MGFHKILKKHDKRLPNPCRNFYLARLHEQSWIRSDYSDILVLMSRVYSKLRGDDDEEEEGGEGKAKGGGEGMKQAFVRSTRKYWVNLEDISTIKYTILQHLPVFLQKSSKSGGGGGVGVEGEPTDSQLVNSVYLDNAAMELYKGRLEKSPGAIALRFRWYGNEEPPKVVYVERKTHRDAWTGEVSVKERFIIQENQVLSLLQGKFPLEEEIQKLINKGKSEEEIEEYRKLATEIIQVIQSKQLFPFMRTQYMRTAFQIPFDAKVRISLDTNLCMITERVKETLEGSRWYRNPHTIVPLNEITRFPHGVLEIKLQLEDENQTPEWVKGLLNSGKLMEIHKFSKFIHGCAVLMMDDVPAVPYWIDDPSLAESIHISGAAKLLEGKPKGANKYYKHLIPNKGDNNGKTAPNTYDLVQPLLVGKPMGLASVAGIEDQINSFGPSSYNDSMGISSKTVEPPKHGWTCCWGKRDNEDNYPNVNNHHADDAGEDYYDGCITLFCGEWAISARVEHMTFQKVEPKLFFANERTFLSWLQMAVLLGSASIGVLAFSSKNSKSKKSHILCPYLEFVF